MGDSPGSGAGGSPGREGKTEGPRLSPARVGFTVGWPLEAQLCLLQDAALDVCHWAGSGSRPGLRHVEFSRWY